MILLAIHVRVRKISGLKIQEVESAVLNLRSNLSNVDTAMRPC